MAIAQPLAALPPYGCGIPLAGASALQAFSILLQSILQRAPAGAGTLSVSFTDSSPRENQGVAARPETSLCEGGGTVKP